MKWILSQLHLICTLRQIIQLSLVMLLTLRMVMPMVWVTCMFVVMFVMTMHDVLLMMCPDGVYDCDGGDDYGGYGDDYYGGDYSGKYSD